MDESINMKAKLVTFVVIACASVFGSGLGDLAKIYVLENAPSFMPSATELMRARIASFSMVASQIVIAYVAASILPDLVKKYTDKTQNGSLGR